MLHLEIGFAVHLHAAFARKERSDVLDAAGGVEPDLGAVGQHHLRTFAQMGDDGQGLRKAFGKRHGGNAPGQQNHRHGGGSGGAERDAAQGDAASGVHAALELTERTLDVDTGRIVDTVVDI